MEKHACISIQVSFMLKPFVCVVRDLYLNLSRTWSFLYFKLLESVTVVTQAVKYNHKINKFVLECISHVY